ncbi:MAG: hypothetical protein ISR96_09955 [Nitrospira sp.]|nr:hypothetical protein [Nitrospira sp.]
MKAKYSFLTLALIFIVAVSQALAAVPEALEYRYDNGGQDPFNAGYVDTDGNVYIAGARGNSSSNIPAMSYYVVKFNSLGAEQWRSTYVTGQASWYGQNSSMTVKDGYVYQVLSESYRFGSIVKYDLTGNPQVLNAGTTVPYNWDHKLIPIITRGDIPVTFMD